jgi:hypothetical protein
LPKTLAGKTGTCDRCFNDFVIPDQTQDKPQLKKTVVFPCKFCGQKQWRETSSIGQKVPCVRCGEKIEVPENFDQTTLLKPEITEPERILFWCAHCGQKYRLPKKLAGKKATCDRCQNDFIIPHESQSQPSPDDIITFPCENCGQKVRKSKTLAGKKFTCRECGRRGIIPLKSKKSLIEIVSQKKILKPFVSADSTKKKFPSSHPNANDEVRTQISTTPVSAAKFEPPSPVQRLRDLKAGVPLKVEIVSVSREAKSTSAKPLRVELISDGDQNRLIEALLGSKATKEQNKILETLLEDKTAKEKNELLKALLEEKKNKKENEPEAKGKTPDFKKKDAKNTLSKEKTNKPGFVPKPSSNARKSSTFTPAPPKIILKPKQEDIDNVPVETIPDNKQEGSLFEPTKQIKLSRKSIVSDLNKAEAETETESGQTPEAEGKSNKLSVEELVQKRTNGEEAPAAKAPPKFKRPKFKPLDGNNEDKVPKVEDYLSPQIVITEDPPAIHKIKNYFQQKAEKYFFFALLTIFVDYLIDTYGDDYRPSKTFIFFCTFVIAGIIALATWKYVTYEPPDNATNCPYNVKCTNKKCKFHGIHRFKDIYNQLCPKCSKPLGLIYRCRNCGREFIFNEKEERQKNRKELLKITKIKQKWHGGKIKFQKTMYNNHLVKKCPVCQSTDIFYVTVKMAEKEAAEREKIKAQQKAAKEAEKLLRKKRGGKKRKKTAKKKRRKKIKRK